MREQEKSLWTETMKKKSSTVLTAAGVSKLQIPFRIGRADLYFTAGVKSESALHSKFCRNAETWNCLFFGLFFIKTPSTEYFTAVTTL